MPHAKAREGRGGTDFLTGLTGFSEATCIHWKLAENTSCVTLFREFSERADCGIPERPFQRTRRRPAWQDYGAAGIKPSQGRVLYIMTRKASDIFCLREVFGVQFSVFSRSDAEGEMLIKKKKKGILQEEAELTERNLWVGALEAVEGVAGGGRGEEDLVAVVGDGDGVGHREPIGGGEVGNLLEGVLAGRRGPGRGELVGGGDDIEGWGEDLSFHIAADGSKKAGAIRTAGDGVGGIYHACVVINPCGAKISGDINLVVNVGDKKASVGG